VAAASLACALSFAILSFPIGARGETIEVEFEGKTFSIDVPHSGPEGGVLQPSAPVAQHFGPPSVFSAPLPSGSGARALGQGCAFTAVADDATAASWNPAGLMHLERPEASVVTRFSHEINDHTSASDELAVGQDSFQNISPNYISAALPFRVARRNWVFSANYQEAYDFTRRFTGDIRQRSTETVTDSRTGTFTETMQDTEWDTIVEFILDTEATTESHTDIRQILTSDMLSSLEFEQQGILDAVSPALAVDLTPRMACGGAVNFYHVNPARGQPIRSDMTATYSGTTVSESTLVTEQTTRSTTHVTSWVHWEMQWPGAPTLPGVEGDVENDPFKDTTTTHRRDVVAFDGEYEEINEYHEFEGVNATFGFLCTVSRYLDLGCTVDLPWTARAVQTRRVRHRVTTYDEARSTVLDVSETTDEQTRQITMDFPLYCAVGALVRWNNRFHSALDVSRTQWSDFAFQVEGEDKVNPLDGTPFGEKPVPDCWTVCCGQELLWVLRATEIPFRGGVIWEQRPAIGTPDQYWGVSLGSGISVGKDPGKFIIDFAYICTVGQDVMGSLVPDQEGLRTDVLKQQGYVSGIVHF